MAADRIFEEVPHERRLRVLVVDGNADERERVHQALGEEYSVEFVSGVREALDAVRAATPDLLVSEVDLPEGSGFHLCEQVRKLADIRHLPIMLLTSRASIHDKVAGFQSGADDYVVKPLDMRLFNARLRLLYRIKGLERPRRELGA